MKTHHPSQRRLRDLAIVSLLCLCLLCTWAVTPAPSVFAAGTPTPANTFSSPVQTTAVRNANLRSGPGTNYPVVGNVKTGQAIKVSGCNQNCSWYQLDTGAWIAASLVEKLPVAASPANQTPATTPTPTATTVNITAMANTITKDVGKIMSVTEGNPAQIVFVFAETHISVVGQVEIAIMLNRLYENYGLRAMGLEGAVTEDGTLLDTTWFHQPPPFEARDPVYPREDVIAQLLQDGEISSMEFMALIYADTKVAPIEIKKQYGVEVAEDAYVALPIYLYNIAIPGMTQAEIGKANGMGQTPEAIEFIMSTDEFTQKAYAQLGDSNADLSCTEWVTFINEIKERAAKTGAQVTAEDKANIENVKTFFQTCDDRSVTMVDKTLAHMKKYPGAPVAMSIGAAHTDEVSHHLANAGVSFAVIQPVSLATDEQAGSLWTEAYDRKMLALSIDPIGNLGALLDSRKKPPPVIDQPWLQSNSELHLLTTLVARALAEGQQPPFDATLKAILPRLKNVTLVPNSFQIIENDVIFSANVLDNDSQPVQIWVRTRVDPKLVKKGMLLEERLFKALTEVREKTWGPEPEKEPSELVLIKASSDTIAKFSTDQAAILETTLEG